jgi:hypothetical protein
MIEAAAMDLRAICEAGKLLPIKGTSKSMQFTMLFYPGPRVYGAAIFLFTQLLQSPSSWNDNSVLSTSTHYYRLQGKWAASAEECG